MYCIAEIPESKVTRQVSCGQAAFKHPGVMKDNSHLLWMQGMTPAISENMRLKVFNYSQETEHFFQKNI